MGLSSYESPEIYGKPEDLVIAVIPKMNCEDHLIHLKVGQLTVVLSMVNAKNLMRMLRGTIEDIEGKAEGRRALASLKDYHEVG